MELLPKYLRSTCASGVKAPLRVFFACLVAAMSQFAVAGAVCSSSLRRTAVISLEYTSCCSLVNFVVSIASTPLASRIHMKSHLPADESWRSCDIDMGGVLICGLRSKISLPFFSFFSALAASRPCGVGRRACCSLHDLRMTSHVGCSRHILRQC